MRPFSRLILGEFFFSSSTVFKTGCQLDIRVRSRPSLVQKLVAKPQEEENQYFLWPHEYSK